MSFRGVNLDGQVVLFGDDALRHQFNRAAQRLIKDPSTAKRVVKSLLSHEILSFDKGRMAEEQLRHQRANSCRLRGGKLMAALNVGGLIFMGLEGCIGAPQLTSKKFVGHSVKYLDIDEARLLLSIERHPHGGKGLILVQYWLHDDDAKTLRLLEERQSVQEACLTGPMRIPKKGQWQPIDSIREDFFFGEVESWFGRDFRHTIAKSFSPQESGLIHHNTLSEKINEQIKLLTGTDIRQREEEESQKREACHLTKYGSQQSNAPPGIYIVPGAFRIGMGSEGPPTKL